MKTRFDRRSKPARLIVVRTIELDGRMYALGADLRWYLGKPKRLRATRDRRTGNRVITHEVWPVLSPRVLKRLRRAARKANR